MNGYGNRLINLWSTAYLWYSRLVSTTYYQSGVNYLLMDEFKNACIKAGKNAAQLIEFPDFYLADVLEGIGSMNQLADDIYKKTGTDFYYQVGWGNVATILNDLVAVGAMPLTLKLFVGAGNEKWFADKVRWNNLIRGFKEAADYAQVLWNGGETQTLVKTINQDSIVLAGSSTGIIQPKSFLIDEKNIKAGDVIIFFQSSGIHTNGITLVRNIFQDDMKSSIEAITQKTLIYSPLVLKLLKKGINIHYASHITGHGWRKIMRSKRDFLYRIEKIPEPQTIFKLIQKKAKLTDFQMYSDFNMGIGYAIFIQEKDVNLALNIAKKMSFKALKAGLVEKGERKVVIEPLNIILDGKSLKIR